MTNRFLLLFYGFGREMSNKRAFCPLICCPRSVEKIGSVAQKTARKRKVGPEHIPFCIRRLDGGFGGRGFFCGGRRILVLAALTPAARIGHTINSKLCR